MNVTILRPNPLYAALRRTGTGVLSFEAECGSREHCLRVARQWGGPDGKTIVVGELLALLDLLVDHRDPEVQALKTAPGGNGTLRTGADPAGWLHVAGLPDPAVAVLLAGVAVRQGRLPAAIGAALVTEAMALLRSIATVH